MIKKTIMLFLSMIIAYSVHAINDSPQGIIVDGSLTGTTPIELTGKNSDALNLLTLTRYQAHIKLIS